MRNKGEMEPGPNSPDMHEKLDDQENLKTIRRSRVSVFEVAELLKQNLAEFGIPEHEQKEFVELIDEARTIHAENPSGNPDYVLTRLSIAAGLKEKVKGLLESDNSQSRRSDREIPIAVLRSLAQSLESSTKLKSDFTAEEGVAEIQRRWAEGSNGGGYRNIMRGAGEKIRSLTERGVRSALERLKGLIPTEKREAVIEYASRNSGRVAFGLTVFGMGLLALGASTKSAEAAMDVTEHQAGKIRIENDETGEVLKIIPIQRIPYFKIENPKIDDSFFERLATAEDSKTPGVNYEIENEVEFTEQILDDAEEMARTLFGKDLKDVSPAQFVKLINAMVQEKIEYDHLSIQDSAEGKVRNKEINEIPIDRMYLSTHLGVCRHYAALVEEIGERLQATGSVPRCEGIRIDEIVNIDDLLHAWNVYYFNLNEDGDKVSVSYTDATWDDNTKKFFDNLEAKEPTHPSIAAHIGPHEVFTMGETVEIMEQLDEINLGSNEGAAVKRFLAEFDTMAYEEKAESLLTETHLATGVGLRPNELDDEAKQLLERSFDTWRETIEVSNPRIVELYSGKLIESWQRIVEVAKADGDVDKALDYSNRVFATFLAKGATGYVYTATETMAGLHETKGDLVAVEDCYRRAIELMPPSYAKYKIIEAQHNFYIEHGNNTAVIALIENLESEGQAGDWVSSPLSKFFEAKIEARRNNTPRALELINEARTGIQTIMNGAKGTPLETLAVASSIEHELITLSLKLGVPPPATVESPRPEKG